jgi:proteasome lid subunit RPN8/RPN11
MDTTELEIGARANHDMLLHVARGGAMEVAGLLGGTLRHRRAVAIVAVPLTNLGGERIFVVDPYSQYCGMRALDQLGLMLVGIYHSHPRGAPILSKVDIAFARRWSCCQVIIAGEDGHRSAAAYMVSNDGELHAIPLITRDDSAAIHIPPR